MRRSRLALIALPVLVVSLSGCVQGGQGEALGSDRWFIYSGHSADVAKKCVNLVRPNEISGLPNFTWGGTQFSKIEVEQSAKNERWFTVNGTLEFLYTDGASPVVKWTCYVPEWGSAGSITSYEVVE